jgi:O-antigen ligase
VALALHFSGVMLQFSQTPPQDHAASVRWFNPSPPADKMPRVQLVAAGALGLLVLCLLIYPFAAKILLVATALAALPWAINATRQNPSWLLIVFALIEAATASAFVSGTDQPLGAFIRYPLGFLFVLPLLPALWKSRILSKGGFRDYAIYLAWAIISAGYSILPGVSFTRAIAATLPFCALCVIATELRSGQDARRVMGVFLTGCGLVVAANYVAYLIPVDTTWQPDPDSGLLRFAGYFTEPNELGGLVLATLGAGFCYWPVASGWRRILATVTMIAALLQCIMADSRSPLVAIAIGCAVYLPFKYRLKGALGAVALFAIFFYIASAVPSMRIYFDRGDVASFTGRQEAWDFAVRRVKDNPILGYGYEVEGQILKSPYFSGWDEVWNLGYQTSLHDGYVSRAISLGVPAMLFWLFLTLRPAVTCLFRGRDPWRLRSVVPLALMPVLILNFTESISDFRSFSGVLMALAWAILERERLFAKAETAMRVKAVEASKTSIVRALQSGAA